MATFERGGVGKRRWASVEFRRHGRHLFYLTTKARFLNGLAKQASCRYGNINKGTKANSWIVRIHLVSVSISRAPCIWGGRTGEFFVITRPIQGTIGTAQINVKIDENSSYK